MTQVCGIGDVYIKTNNNIILLLKNVKYVPHIKMNLISIRRLDNEGYVNTLSDD